MKKTIITVYFNYTELGYGIGFGDLDFHYYNGVNVARWVADFKTLGYITSKVGLDRECYIPWTAVNLITVKEVEE